MRCQATPDFRHPEINFQHLAPGHIKLSQTFATLLLYSNFRLDILTPKLSGSENDILVLHPGISETCEIHYVTDADRRSFSDDCDLGVYTLRYTHPYPILAGKSIPVDVHPIGPVLSTPVAVMWGEGVGGQRAAILASETHIIYEYGLCMHAVRFGSVCRA